METELARLREAFVASARERFALAAGAADRLAAAPTDPEAMRTLRAQFHWLANWGAMYGFAAAATTGRRADEEVTLAILTGAVADSETVARWKGFAAAMAGELAAAEASRWVTAGRSRFLVYTRRPGRFAGRNGSRGPIDTPCCDVVEDLDAAARSLAEPSVAAVILDLAAPLGELVALVAAVRATGGAWRPIPPIVGLADGQGVLDRFRLTQAGVDAIVPASAPEAEITRAALRVVRETAVFRGTVFLLGTDRDVRERVENDLVAEGFRFRAFGDVQDLLRAWLETPPDLVLACTVKGAVGSLRTVRDLRDDSHSNRLPIVVVTDRVDPEDRKAFFEAGASDWLLFPYAPAELLSRVRDAVDQRALLARAPGSPSV
jgi:DNA-binding response OmpR family regulator